MNRDKAVKKAVILGAGKTGRGYLARLLAASEVSVTFIEEDRLLAEKMRREGSYTVSFFRTGRPSVVMKGFRIFGWEEPEAGQSLEEADLICTAIGADRLSRIVPQLKESAVHRQKEGETEKQILLVCENGIHPGRVLEERLGECYQVAEGIVFCTTLEDGLDIRSEDLDWLPYDGRKLSWEPELFGFEKEIHFAELLERKIYTYNCLSACICYLGAEKGHSVFAEAAADPFVRKWIGKIRSPLNRAVAKEYGLPEEEQEAFFEQAYGKFTDKGIADTVSRNGRNVQRKLGRRERIIGPLYLALKYGEPIEGFERLAASALRYGRDTGEFQIRDESCVEGILRETADIQERWLVGEILEIYKNIRRYE